MINYLIKFYQTLTNHHYSCISGYDFGRSQSFQWSCHSSIKLEYFYFRCLPIQVVLLFEKSIKQHFPFENKYLFYHNNFPLFDLKK